jgi:pyruvate dehydrogenase E2 component (dihydrolipoamide acetyltransferase)
MAEVIKMPKMSDTKTEGVIASWHKKVGDQVKAGEVLAEVETDKATMELESYETGTLLYIGVKEKEAVPVDAVISVIGKSGENIDALISGASGGSIQVTEAPATAAKATAPAAAPADHATLDEPLPQTLVVEAGLIEQGGVEQQLQQGRGDL